MKYSKIKAIQKIVSDTPIPVYDIEVKNNHNFAVSNGLIVHNCVPYAYLKNAIYEKRIVIYEDCPLLTEELLGLERNNNTGHIDHPDSGRYGSKDQADCLAGAIYNASKHGEEFNFEYGETLDAMVDVSNEMSYDNTKAQMVIDFEEELKKVSMDFSSSLNVNNNKNTNPLSSYGFGYDIRVDDLAIMDGIIL